MDINIVYNEIIEILKESDELATISKLETLLAAAATGSEGLASTGKYLFDLRKNSPKIYESIKEPVAKYLKYCERNGIIIM